MKYKKIVCLDYAGKELSRDSWKRIDQLCKQRKFVTRDKLDGELADTDCLLVKLGATIDKNIIDKAPNLHYIGMLGTGIGRIDTKYATKKGIVVRNIAGYSTEGVAELAFGLLFEHIREITRAKLQAEKGNYSESSFSGYEIKDKKFGVIGLGKIGARIAEIAQNGFGAKVSYWSKHRKREVEKRGICYKTVEKILQESDFISINLALVSQTKDFLNKERIERIKSGAVVINLAPMELVDVPALAKRLAKNDMTFILDHADELSDDQTKLLSQYKNCIMYPPIGFTTKEATTAKQTLFIKNLENF